MTVIDHGKWLPYTPDVLPKHAPSHALFAKRESDGVDWYDYVNSGENFDVDNVKFMAVLRDYAGGHVVGPAVYDPTLLFPANHLVGEITDYAGSDPQKDFGGKIYNPEDGSFSDPPPTKVVKQ